MKKSDKFIWRDNEATISQCIACKHWVRGGVCQAFPQGVPDAILTNEHDHREQYPGDNGIRFEPLEELANA